MNAPQKLYCVITDIDDDIRNQYIKDNDYDESAYYSKDKHVGRIMVARYEGYYGDDKLFEFGSPVGFFGLQSHEMDGSCDVVVSECVMRCFTNLQDAIAFSKKINPSPVMGRGINVDILQEQRNRKMRKNRVRLSESQLHRVIKESVNSVLREHWMDSQRHKFIDGTSILNGHGGGGEEGSLWNANHKDIIEMANQLHRKCWDEALRLRDEYEANSNDDYFDESGNVRSQIQCLEELCHFLDSFTHQAKSFID